jgi:hypothetical protein
VVVVLAAFAACSPVVDDARPEVSAPEPLAGEPLAAESLAPEVVLHPAPEPATVPLYGGTMERFGVDGVVAADPAGDVVVFVDFERTIEIPTGRFTQPFRLLAEDGGVWVTLRGSGEVARVEPDAAAVVRRSWVCPEPRGLERIPDGPLVVACASGELVALDDQGRPERTVLLATDLRDVAYADDRLYVSRFRAAEVLEVDPWTLAERGRAGFGRHANTAWRMRAGGAGGVLVLHQRGSGKVIEEDAEPVPDDSGLVDVDVDGVVSSSPYGGGGHSECRSVQQAAISRVRFGVATTGPQLAFVAVGVDFVEARQGIHVVGSSVNGPLVSDFGTADSVLAAGGCAMPTARRGAPGSDGIGAAVVVSGGRVWVQGAEPAGVGVATDSQRWRSSRRDRASVLFHRPTDADLACASCHPEGRDDGHVWTFGDIEGVSHPGERRTMSLAGGVSQRAPFHWGGEFPTGDDLVRSTFEHRMGGRALEPEQIDGLFTWLDGLRPVVTTTGADAAALERGRASFEARGCAGCHAGTALTNGALEVVRADGIPVKTPSLVGVGQLDRLMHDGCARSIEHRLTGDPACTGGDLHGSVSDLGGAELRDLAAYLRSL